MRFFATFTADDTSLHPTINYIRFGGFLPRKKETDDQRTIEGSPRTKKEL